MKLSSPPAPDKTESVLDLDAFLPFQLSVAANAVSEVIASAYRSLFGLKVAEWRVLAIVAQSPGLSSQAIARRAVLDKISVSRAVAALAARGLVTAAGDPADRRAHRLALTPAGERLYAAVVPAARALEARVTGCLDAAEQAQLTALLARVRDAAREAAGG